MLQHIVSLLLSMILMAGGTHGLILALAALSVRWQCSKLWMGAIVLGFATSAPEWLVAVAASWHDQPTMAMGSAVGSNIANIGLVLGCSAALMPVQIPSVVMQRELRMLMAATLGVGLMLSMPYLTMWPPNRWYGVVLALAGIGCVYAMAHGRATGASPSQHHTPLDTSQATSQARMMTQALIGLLALLIGAEWLVQSATAVATAWGVSDAIIGLSVVAVGTSLPELVSSLVGTLHGENDMIVGNIIGSGLFNLLFVMAVPLCLAPTALPQHMITRDIPALWLFTLALYMVCRGFGQRKPCVHRWEGGLLLLAYIGYIAWIALNT